MSRLTKRHSDGTVGISQFRYYNYDDFQKLTKKLAYYEDLEEQGLLFKSPYKIGDIIYLCMSQGIMELKISCIEFWHDMKPFYRTYKVVNGEGGKPFGVDDIGKTVFLTKEEAEKELERLRKNE